MFYTLSFIQFRTNFCCFWSNGVSLYCFPNFAIAQYMVQTESEIHFYLILLSNLNCMCTTYRVTYSTRLTGSINNSEALVLTLEIAREVYLKRWYNSYYFTRIDLSQSLKQRGIQTIDIFALAKLMGVQFIEYNADSGIWGYYAGNNRGCEDGAIYTWFETRKDNEAHSMIVVGALNKPKESKPKSPRF